MIKKILLFVVVFAIALGFTGVQEANAIENIEVTGSYYYFASKGTLPESGYSFKLTLPTGVDLQSVQEVTERLKAVDTGVVIVQDTTYTYTLQWMVEGEIVKSNYDVGDGVKEVESTVLTTFLRKSVGFWTVFADVGITVWDFANTDGANKKYDGYHLGVGCVPYKALKVKAGAFILPMTESPDVYVFGLNVGYKF